MQLVIPMSGLGTRFIESGYDIPKPLIPISGKPMIQHVIEMFPEIEDVLFIVNDKHINNPELDLESQLLQISPNCKISVVKSHKLGPAWAISQARDAIDLNASVVVNYCDFACMWDFTAFKEMLESGIDGLIATYSGFHPHMLANNQYSYLKLDKDGFLLEIQEKSPFTNNPMNEPASSGTYGFRSGQVLLDAIDSQIRDNHSYNSEFYSSLTYKSMIQKDLRIKNFNVEKFFQWGTPQDLEEFKRQKDYFLFRQRPHALRCEPHRVSVLAAGAGQRFIDAGYKDLKPFLQLGESFLAIEALHAVGSNSKATDILLQTSSKIPKRFSKLLESNGVNIITIENITTGQATSALVVLETAQEGNCIIATCDSLLFPKVDFSFENFEDKTIGVWVTDPSPIARNNPNQFGWVSTNEVGDVLNTWVKKCPENLDTAKVITGTFVFASAREAKFLLTEFLGADIPVNGEYYLDSVLNYAINQGWRVVALEPEWFIGLGTPDEYETYLYWNSVFMDRKDLLEADEISK